MAAGSSAKPPSAVTVNDDDPKSGYVTLYLDFPELKVKKALIGQPKADNCDVTINITDSDVAVHVSFHSNKGAYVYKKKLPEDINSSKSSSKLKTGAVVLKLCKSETGSWSPHVKYLMSRE